MSTNGRQLIRQLGDYLDNVTTRYSVASKEERRLQDSINAYSSKKVSLYRSLAKHYLPTIEQDVNSAISEFHDDVEVLEEQLGVDFENIAQEIKGSEKSKVGRLEELEEIDEKLDALLGKRFELESKFDTRVANDAEIEDLNQKALVASEQISGSLEALKKFESEADEKLPEFEANPYFKYLLDRNYGEESYRAFFPVKSLDGWVGKLCNYTENKATRAN